MDVGSRRWVLGFFLVTTILVSGCVQQQLPSSSTTDGASDGFKQGTTPPAYEATSLPAKEREATFSCENDHRIRKRAYVLLMGLGDHDKAVWNEEKRLMEQDPKADGILIYDQDENKHLQEISSLFLADLNQFLAEHDAEELVIFGSSAGGVTSSHAISKLNFSGPVALHTLASPLKGYGLTGPRAQYLGDRQGYLRDIAIGFEPFDSPPTNVKVYHHKTVTDSVLKAYCGPLAAFCDPIEVQDNNLAGSKEFFYPQYDHDTIMDGVIHEVLKCYNPALQEVLEEIRKVPKLGNFCTGEEECNDYCKNNYGRCKDYCNNNPSNPLCQKPFAFERPSGQPTEPLNGTLSRQEPTSNEPRSCEGNKTTFDYAPVNLEKTKLFLPLGLMSGSHVTPVDHHYFQNFDNQEADIEVYSPGDGFIESIGHMPGAPEGRDYRVVIVHTCTISSIFIHVETLAEKLATAVLSDGRTAYPRIPVRAGEVIGYYARNVDYNLVDEEITLPGFVVPSHYSGEDWKIHVPNTYDYFNEPVRSKLVAKSLRTAEPMQGKIDYDIDGKLVGNWFLEGTGGYAGKGTGVQEYWSGHLAIAYDYLDPERIVLSIAGYEGQDSKQFAVKGNAPEPATLGVRSGLVKYELVGYDYYAPDGSFWDRKSLVKDLKTRSEETVQGVVLFQLLEDRKLKMEVFPGKTAAQVSGFTQNAKTYER